MTKSVQTIVILALSLVLSMQIFVDRAIEKLNSFSPAACDHSANGPYYKREKSGSEISDHIASEDGDDQV